MFSRKSYRYTLKCQEENENLTFALWCFWSQVESRFSYGLPTSRIKQAAISSAWFPLPCKLKQAPSSTPDINCHCNVYFLSAAALRFQPPSPWTGRGRHGPITLPAGCVVNRCVAVYGLSLKCFSCEALRSDFTRQGFLKRLKLIYGIAREKWLPDVGWKTTLWRKTCFPIGFNYRTWDLSHPHLYPSTLCLWPFCAPLSLGC